MRARGRRGRAAVLAAVLAAAAVVAACVPPPTSVLDAPAGSPVATTPGVPADSSTKVPGDAAGPAQQPTSCAQPEAGSHFEMVPSADAAVTAAAVRAAIDYSSARGANVTQVYRYGCLLGSGGLDPAARWSELPIWSMTKGVVALLVGRAETLGLLSVDDPVGAHVEGLASAQSRITIRQLLQQTSGLRFAWANDLNDAATGDSGIRALKRPMAAEPDAAFVYAQTTVTAVVAVLEAAVGEDIQAFARRELFGPIGLRDSHWSWLRDASGRSHGFAGISITPEGMARIGSLLLNDGVWNGRRLVTSSFIERARTGTDANPGYGYLWWTNEGEWHRQSGYTDKDHFDRRWIRAAPNDMFGMSGMFNQNLFVIPSLDMVVVRMGLPQDVFADPLGEIRGKKPGWDHRFFTLLLDGVTDVDLPTPPEWEKDPEFPLIDLDHVIFFDPDGADD